MIATVAQEGVARGVIKKKKSSTKSKVGDEFKELKVEGSFQGSKPKL